MNNMRISISYKNFSQLKKTLIENPELKDDLDKIIALINKSKDINSTTQLSVDLQPEHLMVKINQLFENLIKKLELNDSEKKEKNIYFRYAFVVLVDILISQKFDLDFEKDINKEIKSTLTNDIQNFYFEVEPFTTYEITNENGYLYFILDVIDENEFQQLKKNIFDFYNQKTIDSSVLKRNIKILVSHLSKEIMADRDSILFSMMVISSIFLDFVQSEKDFKINNVKAKFEEIESSPQAISILLEQNENLFILFENLYFEIIYSKNTTNYYGRNQFCAWINSQTGGNYKFNVKENESDKKHRFTCVLVDEKYKLPALPAEENKKENLFDFADCFPMLVAFINKFLDGLLCRKKYSFYASKEKSKSEGSVPPTACSIQAESGNPPVTQAKFIATF